MQPLTVLRCTDSSDISNNPGCHFCR